MDLPILASNNDQTLLHRIGANIFLRPTQKTIAGSPVYNRDHPPISLNELNTAMVDDNKRDIHCRDIIRLRLGLPRRALFSLIP